MADNYEIFKNQVFAITKIDLSSYKERQMKRRIDALIAKHRITSYSDYIETIRKNPVMFEEFVNYLTINVSEFYRNPEQWKLLEQDVLPYLFNRFGNNLKIWSAACSTGDEPYSLVMLLSKFMPLSRIKVIATDIDKQVLEKAKLGLYNVKSLKGLPPEFLTKYFREINNSTYQIADSIKACVEFRQHNLLKDEYPGQCDLIVCRNVLIYFTEDAKNTIYKKFNSSLKKDGILFVGSTEQIIQPQNLQYTTYKSFFYKKS
ncbi:chemotaxis protein methyltransferase [Anaerocolumna cellulosilytica]|uniref:protein-glutamate O-methyltransferase n=1 Tax=Anaerocolumna cellulosilytica TaxID=433286 RepID=A0A6S6R6P5_9FIRM|nr:protein-glutamate O-methyltransferase CheR [Anaerocolumna cellulosilytica]MBB5197587.1 chemotaxis protein methyltransferase CheR [Anaerocolumna cellulosilytica]BCJ95112.1 chemotaxis protein methyltransferase [Anaerocolumna cellulosilytica]